jgi:metallo-beta-lactamase family protein
MPDVDYLICESTYGGRLHENPVGAEDKLAEVLKKAGARKAKIIIPAFSVGRTQELVYAFHRIFEMKSVPRMPVYVDSPLSVNATDVFRMHPECFDFETSRFLLKHEDPFGFNRLNYITDVEDSKKLNEKEGPMVIIASSGMCEAGRILHHLANNIDNKNNIVLIVGYTAQHTLGRKIVEKEKVVKIFGEEHQLNAEVIVMESFSAHADADELVAYCDNFDKSRMNEIFLVHGDPEQQDIFGNNLSKLGFKKISKPQKGEVFEI